MSENCSENGSDEFIIIANACNCDIGYFGNICSDNIISFHRFAWIMLQIIYTIAYLVIAGFTSLHLVSELVKVINTG